MSSSRLHRRLVLAAGIVVASSLPLAVSADGASTGKPAGADDVDATVVVESTGDPASAVVLPAAAAVGQTATTVATIDISIAAGGRQVDLTVQIGLSSSVTEVADGGGYVTELTVAQVELIDAPAGFDPATTGYAELAGVRFRQTFDRNGLVAATELLDAADLSTAARTSADGLATSLQTAQFVYPDEAVGVGAAWTADMQVATQGFEIPARYRFEITDIAAGRYTLAMSYQGAFDSTIDGVNASGTVTGLGRVSGALDNPLDVTGEVGQTIDASSEGADLRVAIGLRTTSGG